MIRTYTLLSVLLSLVCAGFGPVNAAAAPGTMTTTSKTAAAKTAKTSATDKKAAADKLKATAGAQNLATFGDWGAYLGSSGSSKVCFVLSQPKERLPKGLTRDPAYIFISFRPSQGVKNEIAVTTGFALKPGSEPSAAIGANSFGMMAKDKNAFLRNAAEESQFVDIAKRFELAKRGTGLIVKSRSLRGNENTDRYSLNGFGQALERAIKECM